MERNLTVNVQAVRLGNITYAYLLDVRADLRRFVVELLLWRDSGDGCARAGRRDSTASCSGFKRDDSFDLLQRQSECGGHLLRAPETTGRKLCKTGARK